MDDLAGSPTRPPARPPLPPDPDLLCHRCVTTFPPHSRLHATCYVCARVSCYYCSTTKKNRWERGKEPQQAVLDQISQAELNQSFPFLCLSCQAQAAGVTAANAAPPEDETLPFLRQLVLCELIDAEQLRASLKEGEELFSFPAQSLSLVYQLLQTAPRDVSGDTREKYSAAKRMLELAGALLGSPGHTYNPEQALSPTDKAALAVKHREEYHHIEEERRRRAEEAEWEEGEQREMEQRREEQERADREKARQEQEADQQARLQRQRWEPLSPVDEEASGDRTVDAGDPTTPLAPAPTLPKAPPAGPPGPPLPRQGDEDSEGLREELERRTRDEERRQAAAQRERLSREIQEAQDKAQAEEAKRRALQQELADLEVELSFHRPASAAGSRASASPPLARGPEPGGQERGWAAETGLQPHQRAAGSLLAEARSTRGTWARDFPELGRRSQSVLPELLGSGPPRTRSHLGPDFSTPPRSGPQNASPPIRTMGSGRLDGRPAAPNGPPGHWARSPPQVPSVGQGGRGAVGSQGDGATDGAAGRVGNPAPAAAAPPPPPGVSAEFAYFAQTLAQSLQKPAAQRTPGRGVGLRHLPKIALTSFDGSPSQFREWWETFRDCVDSDPDLTEPLKMLYLRSTLKGRAKKKVEALVTNSSSYKDVLDLLFEFADKGALLDHAEKALRSLPDLSHDNSLAKLEELQLTVTANAVALEEMGIPEARIAASTGLLYHKLPEGARRYMVEAADLGNAVELSMTELRRHLANYIRRERTVRGTQPDTKPKGDGHKGKGAKGGKVGGSAWDQVLDKTPTTLVNQAAPTKAKGGQKGKGPAEKCKGKAKDKPSPPCELCSTTEAPRLHPPWYCPEYETYEDRKRRVNSKKLCFRCLKGSHRASECEEARPCFWCKDAHASTLCQKAIEEKRTVWRSGFGPKGELIRESTSSKTLMNRFSEERDGGGLTNGSLNEEESGEDEGLYGDGPCAYGIHKDGDGDARGVHVMASRKQPSNTIMPTMDALIQNPNEEGLELGVFVYVDLGSSVTIVLKRLALAVNAPVLKANVLMNSVVFGSKEAKKFHADLVLIRLVGSNGQYLDVEAWAVDVVCAPYRAEPVNWPKRFRKELRHRFPSLLNLPASSPVSKEVGVLLGLDYGGALLHNPANRVEMIEGLIVNQTFLGAILYDSDAVEKSAGNQKRQHTITTLMMKNTNLDLQNLFSLEQAAIDAGELTTTPDEEADKLFHEFFRRLPDGRLEVGIPLREWPPNLGGINYHQARARTEGTRRNLLKGGDDHAKINRYDNKIEEMLRDDIIEVVHTKDRPLGPIFYAHHFCVTNQTSTTTKERIVFDSSMGSGKRTSLNDACYAGRNLLEPLVGILIRITLPRYLAVADIVKAFNQLSLHHAHRDLSRFMKWIDPTKPVDDANVVIYRFKRLFFGLRPAPYLLNMAVQQMLIHADRERYDADLIEQVAGLLYVDNVSWGTDRIPAHANNGSLETGFADRILAYKDQLYQLFEEHHLPLAKFATNNAIAMARLPEEEKEKGDPIKLLGLLWHLASDELQLAFIPSAETLWEVDTLRKLVSVAAKVWDLRRRYAPLTCQLLVVAQVAHRQGLTWDEKFSEELLQAAREAVEPLNGIRDDKVPRRTVLDRSVLTYVVAFSDSSRHRYAHCIGLVQQVGNQVVRRFLIGAASPIPTAQAKLPEDIPKTELLALHRCMRQLETAVHYLQKDLAIAGVAAFVDSAIVAQQLVSRKAPSTVFARNRVPKIQAIQKRLGCGVFWIPTDQNPADVGSRQQNAHSFLKSSWHQTDFGPAFLTLPRDQWPALQGPDGGGVAEEVAENSPLERAVNYWEDPEDGHDAKFLKPSEVKLLLSHMRKDVAAEENGPCGINPGRFGTIGKLLAVTAYALRGVRSFKGEPVPKGRPLTGEEFRDARLLWLLSHQKNNFKSVLEALQAGKSSSLVDKYNLQLDKHGVIRCETRFERAPIPEEAQSPALIAAQGHFAALLVMEAHCACGHFKVRLTINFLFRRYRIAGGGHHFVNSLIKGACLQCKRRDGGPYETPGFAPFPDSRFELGLAFRCIGADLKGPFNLLVSASRAKAFTAKHWVLTIVCLATGAVSLGLLKRHDAATLILGFRRHFARHGVPRFLYHDQGSNIITAGKLFAGASGKKAALQEEDLSDFVSMLATHEIVVRTYAVQNPASGGKFEIANRYIGAILQRSGFGKKVVRDDEMEVRLCEVANILNSSPILQVGDFASDGLVLTKAHLMGAGGLRTALPGSAEDAFGSDGWEPGKKLPDLLKVHRGLDKILKKDWKIYQELFYADLLHQRIKDKKAKGLCAEPPAEGDVVLIKEKNTPRLCWSLGRILELVPSTDGKVRQARVQRPSQRVSLQAIKHLYPLVHAERPAEPNPFEGQLSVGEAELDGRREEGPREPADVDPNLEAEADEDDEEPAIAQSQPQVAGEPESTKDPVPQESLLINQFAYALQDAKRSAEEAQAERLVKVFDEADGCEKQMDELKLSGALGRLQQHSPPVEVREAAAETGGQGRRSPSPSSSLLLKYSALCSGSMLFLLTLLLCVGSGGAAGLRREGSTTPDPAQIPVLDEPPRARQPRAPPNPLSADKVGKNSDTALDPYSDPSERFQAETEPHYGFPPPDSHVYQICLEPPGKGGIPLAFPAKHAPCQVPLPEHQHIRREYAVYVPRVELPKTAAVKCQLEYSEVMTYTSVVWGHAVISERHLHRSVNPKLCRDVEKAKRWNGLPLQEVSPGVWSTNQTLDVRFAWCCYLKNCSALNFHLVSGQVGFSGRGLPVSDLGSLAGCEAEAKECVKDEFTVTWAAVPASEFCPFELKGNYTGVTNGDLVVIDALQSAFTLDGSAYAFFAKQGPYYRDHPLKVAGCLPKQSMMTKEHVVLAPLGPDPQGFTAHPAATPAGVNHFRPIYKTEDHPDARQLNKFDLSNAIRIRDWLANNSDAQNPKEHMLVQILEEQITHNFRILHYSYCHLRQTQLEMLYNQLAVDATAAVRTLLHRQDVGAVLHGDLILLHQCHSVKAEKLFLNHRFPDDPDTCYALVPVELDTGARFFVSAGSRDLVPTSPTVPCLGLQPAPIFTEHDRKLGMKNWASIDGAVHAHELAYLGSHIAPNYSALTFSAPKLWNARAIYPAAAQNVWTAKVRELDAKQELLINYTAELSLQPSSVVRSLRAGGFKAALGVVGAVGTGLGSIVTGAWHGLTSLVSNIFGPWLNVILHVFAVLFAIGIVCLVVYFSIVSATFRRLLCRPICWCCRKCRRRRGRGEQDLEREQEREPLQPRPGPREAHVPAGTSSGTLHRRARARARSASRPRSMGNFDEPTVRYQADRGVVSLNEALEGGRTLPRDAGQPGRGRGGLPRLSSQPAAPNASALMESFSSDEVLDLEAVEAAFDAGFSFRPGDGKHKQKNKKDKPKATGLIVTAPPAYAEPSVLFPIFPIIVEEPNNNVKHKLWAIIDTGSSHTFVSQSARRMLRLETRGFDVGPFHVSAFGQHAIDSIPVERVRLEFLTVLDHKFVFEAYSVEYLTPPVPIASMKLPMRAWKELNRLRVVNKPPREHIAHYDVDVIVGMGHFSDIMYPKNAPVYPPIKVTDTLHVLQTLAGNVAVGRGGRTIYDGDLSVDRPASDSSDDSEHYDNLCQYVRPNHSNPDLAYPNPYSQEINKALDRLRPWTPGRESLSNLWQDGRFDDWDSEDEPNVRASPAQ